VFDILKSMEAAWRQLGVTHFEMALKPWGIRDLRLHREQGHFSFFRQQQFNRASSDPMRPLDDN
jgi:hypothetical protein